MCVSVSGCVSVSVCVNELAVQCVESVRLTSDESLRLFLQEDMCVFFFFFFFYKNGVSVLCV